MDRAFRELAFCAPIREQTTEATLDFTPLNLAGYAPRCARENVLLVTSRHDLFAPQDTVDEIEAAWRAEVWRMAHGHISILLSARIMRRIVKWIRARADTPARRGALKDCSASN
jgi:hypothetical protein